MSYPTKNDTLITLWISFLVFSFVALAIGGMIYTGNQNNQKSREISVECIKRGGTFHQGTNGDMTCDGVRR